MMTPETAIDSPQRPGAIDRDEQNPCMYQLRSDNELHQEP